MPIFGFAFFRNGAVGGGGGGGGFTPLTDTYNSSSGTRSVPSGATQLVVEVYSKGGAGGVGSGNGGGGSSGTYSKKTFTVAAGDYGKTITWNTNSGTAATVVGDATATNLTNVALNISAPNGNGGGSSSGGAAPSAPTGGTINLAGNAGQSHAAGSHGGNAPGPIGGTGGAAGTDGAAPGGGGGGGETINLGGGEFDITNGAAGGPRIILAWT